MAETEKKVAATEAAAEKKPAARKTAAKKAEAKAGTVTVKLVKSLSGRGQKQIATAKSLGLVKIGDVTVQPDNAQTAGKIAKISHLVVATKA